jgi:hypothetical protein
MMLLLLAVLLLALYQGTSKADEPTRTQAKRSSVTITRFAVCGTWPSSEP